MADVKHRYALDLPSCEAPVPFEPGPDPLLAWHAAARAEHIEPFNFEWHGGEVRAVDWHANGMLMSARANLMLDNAGVPPSGATTKIHGDRFNAIYSAMRERAASARRPTTGYRKAPKDGTAADVLMRQQTLDKVSEMRFLVWGTLEDEVTPSQWKKVQRTWRKHVLHDRVAFWSESDNSAIVGVAHNPLPPDPIGILSAIRWSPDAEPATLSLIAARMRLRLRGRVPSNLGGQASANKPRPSYQWILDDYQRVNKAAEYGRMYGG